MTHTERSRRLRDVFWIGGSVCAGKSTTADRLGERLGVAVYHFDQHEPFHVIRSVPEAQPAIIRFFCKTMDERWVVTRPDEMAQEAIAAWTERFSMVLDDLDEMLANGPVIAEGVGLFPELVTPLLSDRSHAVWLISTPDFREEVRRTREVTVADSPYISDRERAFNNLLERDMRIASYVEQQARARRLPVVCVNTETIAGTAERLAPQLEAWRRTLA